jgi:iron complex outermembrane receptor protein
MFFASSGAPVRRALLLAGLGVLPGPALADADIIVTAQRQAGAIENPPASAATIDAARIAATVNATNVEDTLKYLPSLVIRKRHIGDTQSPLATRTSGVGASARSLIYADGALLSALIGNNNTSASPRWSLVTPQEIARIDVLYGPFSAAYPGNSIGAVVSITTRLPDALEASAHAGTSIQSFRQYGTDRVLPARAVGGTLGDRFGRLALFLSVDHVDSRSQPLAYVTATRPAAPGSAGTATIGGYDDINRTGAPIRVIGASGFEHQRQTTIKLKAALDLTPDVRLAYVGGLFVNDTDAGAETYLTQGGAPVYAGNLNIGGYPYSVAASAFSNSVYRYDERHWSHALSATGAAGQLDWQVIGTRYRFDHDVQRVPSAALPAAASGGAGNSTRLDGTGWETFDAKASWRSDDMVTHRIGLGAHWDRFTLASNRYALSDWVAGDEGARNLSARGRTRTGALWLQDAWRVTPRVTLTLGGRQEWWRAYGGANFSAAPLLDVAQPTRDAARFSPKASLRWQAGGGWSLTGSFGKAWRFPTVSELYQTVTTGTVLAVPNPDLRPERALSEELALQHADAGGTLRLSLFNESVADALLSQTAPVNGGAQLASYVQNVDTVRTRGIEAAFDRRDLVKGFDLSGSVTVVDAEIRADAAFPAAIGKRPPQIPRRKATLVATWRPIERLSLTAAGRYSSRAFGTIDNSDSVARTYQGFEKYLVVDLRAQLRIGAHVTAAIGVDNVGGERYYLFHPFPQRTVFAQMDWRL